MLLLYADPTQPKGYWATSENGNDATYPRTDQNAFVSCSYLDAKPNCQAPLLIPLKKKVKERKRKRKFLHVASALGDLYLWMMM